jgi:hypothetical protein
MLLTLSALSGADDKNKKPANTPPPPPPRQQAPQGTRPAPQAARPMPPPSRSTNTYHPPNTGTTNTYHPPNTGTSTVNNGTGNPGSTAGGNPNSRTYTPSGNNNTRWNNKGPGNNVPGNNSSPNHATDFNRGVPATGRENDRFGNNGRPMSTNARSYQPVRTTRDFGDRRVAYDRGGRVREIHARGIEVHRSVGGTRTFVAERNGRRIVGLGPHRGYMEHAYLRRNGRVYVQRTYVAGGVRYARAYRSYYWHGGVYYHYVPGFYYRPAFYGWVYNPWPARVVWTWGWGPAPWYGYYGYYFAPYPVYPAASFWLTDYLLAQNLQLAYAAQQNADDNAPVPDANAAPPDQVQLTPEVKQMIADEVQRQLAAERAAAGDSNTSSAAPPATEETPTALDPNSRVFVVSSNLDVVKDDGSECTLTAGDVILRTGTSPDGTKVGVNVITSKRDDCPSNTNTAVEVSDLQEMQNQFREQIDSGLKVLAENQGKSGMPNAPDTAITAGEVPAPPPDSSAQANLEDQRKNAEKAEADVQKAGGGAPQN